MKDCKHGDQLDNEKKETSETPSYCTSMLGKGGGEGTGGQTRNKPVSEENYDFIDLENIHALNSFTLYLRATTARTSSRAPSCKKSFTEPSQSYSADCWTVLQLLQQLSLYYQISDFQTPHLQPPCCFTEQC